MSLWKRLNRSEDGSAAIETVIVLPYQILVITLFLQLAHWMVAHQIVFYATYSACRAALVSDYVQSEIQDGSWKKLKPNTVTTAPAFWGEGTGLVVCPPEARPYRAAANICSLLEVYHKTAAGSFIGLPTGGKFRKDAYKEAGREGNMLQVGSMKHPNLTQENSDITVKVAYEVLLPIPFANQLFYWYFKTAGRASTKHLRVIIWQDATMCRPWK